jgi:valine--pyruvate aminotransferase
VPLRLSKFGQRFARRSGALELMDDLGRAMSGEQEVLLLGGGNPGRIPEVEAVFRRRLHEIAADDDEFGRLLASYAHPQGELTFRRSLARVLSSEYGWDVDAENIALTAGSQVGFFLLFNLLAGEQADGSFRRVLLPLTPEYVGYADLGVSEGLFSARRPAIESLPDDLFKYRVDFESLRLDESIAAVCVSRPTNPTGNVLTDAEIGTLDSMCRDADVPLILDNAYGLPFPNIIFTDAAPFWNENVIYCMSLSKLGLPGARTGIVVANEEVVGALTRMTAILSLAVGSVGPRIVQPLLDSGELLELGRRSIRPYYERKALQCCDWLRRELRGLPFKIHKPEGAIFVWLWLPGLPITSAELYSRLKAAGVLVLSGHYFFPGLEESWAHRDECLRISFALDDDTVREGVALIAREIRKAFSA